MDGRLMPVAGYRAFAAKSTPLFEGN